MGKLHVLLLSILVSSCCEYNKPKPRTYTFIVSEQFNKKDPQGKPISYPQRPFYGDYNMILDGADHVYFYKYERNLNWCGTGIDYTKPKFIELKPSDLTLVGVDSLNTFLNSNLVKNIEFGQTIVIISSTQDTIRSAAFDALMSIPRLKDSLDWAVRQRTEEESVVLQHYKTGKTYDYKDVAWKTKFRHGWPQ